MKIAKFKGANLKEALARVKDELGPEAMIVTTRQLGGALLGGGIEVTAALDDPTDEVGGAPKSDIKDLAPASAGLEESDVERIVGPLRSELRTLRTIIRSMAENRAGRELRDEVSALRQAIAPLRGQMQPDGQLPVDEVARNHVLAAPSNKRITVIVGPTGVGKTTTIAKLAARAALIENRSVAIASMDTYRVGGEDQIRIYANLIGAPLTLIGDPSHFNIALQRMEGVDRIFVDTAGRSPRDGRALSQLAEALVGHRDIEIHLALAAATAPGSMDLWMDRCRSLGVSRLLITKVDEAECTEELVRAPARLKTPIAYFTTGQRVPEDIEDASQERLLHLATHGFLSAELAA